MRLPVFVFSALLLCVFCRSAPAQTASKAQSNQPSTADSLDTATAIRKAAEKGNAAAQCLLGLAYEFGRGGLPQDYARAAVWYHKAADQGFAEAQDRLGSMYQVGHGVPQDYAQATGWYRKAAVQGLADAQNMLGYAYENGYGVAQDYAQAAMWYHKAAKQGDALAQWSLGLLYELGHGEPQDYAEAYFWLDVAAANKIVGVKQEDIDKIRDDAASHLTPADLSRVQEQARKWTEVHSAKVDAQ